MAVGGPGCFVGFLLLALAVAPAVILDTSPWQQIAIVNAATHFVTGFSWTMVGTRSGPLPSIHFKNLGITLWFLTILLSVALLIAAVFVD